MRKLTLVAAAMAALASAPAMAAGEARVEARGGLAWAAGSEDFVAGLAAGYDFDLGGAFVGPEVSYDTNFDGVDAVNLGARVGAKLGAGKLYAIAAYDVGDIDEFNLGAGYQHNFGEKFYGKIEYRRYLLNGTDLNVGQVGVGIKF